MGNGEPKSLAHIGERALDSGRITLIEYDADEMTERELLPGAIAELPESGAVRWINVDGITDTAALDALAARFHIHPLVVEDIANGQQRPKLEEYDDCLFIVLRMLSVDGDGERITSEQVSVVLGKSFVITFQMREGDVFDDVRNRIRNSVGKIRRLGPDYLAYRLIDAIVDHYFVALDAMGDLIENVETEMTDDPTSIGVRDLHMLKRETLFLRRSIVPARELVATLAKMDDNDYVQPATLVFLRDVYDHLIQVTETLEVQRGILASMTDVYHAAISNRMNEIVKVMTMVSTIFIPLSFIAGVYGMNFEYMPGLKEPWGLPACVAAMLAVGAGMLLFFRRKRWL